MSTLENLYKIHINKDADASEFYEFLKMFDLNGIYIAHYDSDIEKMQQERHVMKINYAMEWIFKNSKT